MTEKFEGIHQAKFSIPTVSSNFISRPRLLSQLQAGMICKLTLISAPAGFGKSSLVAYWLKHVDYPHIWISLNLEDNDHVHLAKSIIKSMRKIKSNFGDELLKNYNSLITNRFTDAISRMIKELENFTDEFIIVFDDYQHIQSTIIHDGLSFFLNNMPNQCHLYLICRLDPPLSLTRFKVAEELIEIREKDLRFNLKETDAFFSAISDIQLSQSQIKYLYQISEGWVASLRMIGFSIKAKEYTEDLLKIINDSGREISDYLEEEVFSLQSEDVKFFLLTTSILTKLTPLLCDAVTGKSNSLQMLRTLEKLNLFIIPLNHKSSLFRYHHFFSDMLQTRLVETYPDIISDLHLRASKWYLENNYIGDAIYHAHASQYDEFNADIVEAHAEEAMIKGELISAKNWIDSIPEQIILKRPKLMIYKSTILLLNGSQIQEVEKYYAQSQKILLEELAAQRVSEGPQIQDLHTMIGRTYLGKALILSMHSQYGQAKKNCTEAMKYVPKDGLSDVLTMLIYGYCSLTEGKIDDAEIQAWEAMALYNPLKIPHIESLMITITILIELHRGKLSRADSITSSALETYKDRINASESIAEPYALLLIMKGEILRERNRLKEAEELLLKGIGLIKHAMPPNIVAHGYICLSRTAFAKGSIEEAMTIINDAENRYWPINMFLTDYLPAYKAQLDILSGHIDKAGQLIKKSEFIKKGKFTIENDIHYSEMLTLSRYYIGKKKHNESIYILNEILDKSKTDLRMKRHLEALILLSIALKKSGNNRDALHTLGQAITISVHEGYCRIFLDEGDELIELLYRLLKNSSQYGMEENIPYIKNLIRESTRNELSGLSNTDLKTAQSLKYNLDPLTKRELEVLYQLSQGLRNKEIGEKLCISLATVKTHIHQILSKLNTDNRNKAIIEARNMGLLDVYEK